MKLLIVDDEPDIREGIRAGIDWESFGIEKTLSAADAFEALRICEKEQPEILITDISMPRMSGIELIEKCKTLNPHLRSILLSGYSEFEYAKQAIRLGVTAYEVKPMKVNRLKDLVLRMKEEIEAERRKDSAWKLDDYADSCYFIKKLVQSKGIMPGQQYAQGMNALSLVQEDHILCMYLQTDRYGHGQEIICENKEWMERLNGLCEKWLGEHQFFLVKLRAEVSLLLWKNAEHKQRVIPQLFREGNDMTRAMFQITFSMGVGNEGTMSDFYTLYTQARMAARNKIYTGRASLLYYSDDRNKKDISSHYLVDTKMYETLQREYVDGEMEKVRAILDGAFRDIREQRSYTYTALKDFCVDLVNLLYRICQDCSLNQPKSCGEVIEDMDSVCDTIEEFGTYIQKLYEEWHLKIRAMSCPTGNRVIQETVDYVKKHFTQELSIEEIARDMGVTPNYLSHLFNREMKVTFREYLNQYRIYKAKWYLENTNDKAYEIAGKVGFREYKHFAQIFKKYEGCSTLQYRNQIGKRGIQIPLRSGPANPVIKESCQVSQSPSDGNRPPDSPQPERGNRCQQIGERYAGAQGDDCENHGNTGTPQPAV